MRHRPFRTYANGCPRAIYIPPYIYQVHLVRMSGTDEGDCEHFGCLIRLRRDLHPDRMRQVLLHEVLHACWDAGEVPYHLQNMRREKKGRFVATSAVEESAVRALVPPLVEALRLNPHLRRFLWREGERCANG